MQFVNTLHNCCCGVLECPLAVAVKLQFSHVNQCSSKLHHLLDQCVVRDDMPLMSI